MKLPAEALLVGEGEVVIFLFPVRGEFSDALLLSRAGIISFAFESNLEQAQKSYR